MSCTRSEEAQKFYGFRVDVDPDGEPKFEFFKEKQGFEIPEGEVPYEIGDPGVNFPTAEQYDAWRGEIRWLCEKYGVAPTEVLFGFNIVPPADPSCKVYVSISIHGMIEFFRKGKSPFGYWVCWNDASKERI